MITVYRNVTSHTLRDTVQQAYPEGEQVAPKHRYLSVKPYGVKSHRTAIFINTACDCHGSHWLPDLYSGEEAVFIVETQNFHKCSL